MYTISKMFRFEAAHHLEGVAEDHKCRRPHGHSYRVLVELKAEDVDERGFVRDYADLDNIKSWINARLDHRDLNEELPWLNGSTTAENLARTVYYTFIEQFPQITQVGVSETENTWAFYTPTVVGDESEDIRRGS